MNKIYDIKKSDFYDRYYNYIKTNDSFLNDEYKITKKSLQKIRRKNNVGVEKLKINLQYTLGVSRSNGNKFIRE